MQNYDFSSVNDKDFESLACSLLGRHLSQRIERFKPGKNQGIDGRFFRNEKMEVIQVKHFARSGYSKFIAELKKEVPKVRKLNPSRYFIAVSLPLSAHNKSEISKLFLGFVKSECDIFGSEDLNDILAEHPDVERRFWGLWMTSANVLQRIIHSGVYGRSEFEREGIIRESKLFVETSDFVAAGKLLDDVHSIVITGAPGIGKTTLAKMLILRYINEGYELVSVQNGISEAENVFGTHSERKMFYFDDFLGRNLYEAVHAKDSAVVNFIKRVKSEKLKRFILTSRTYILNQGRELNDLFVINNIKRNEYEVKIESISHLDRAKLLYNHLWHSELESEFLDEYYTDKRFLKIIKHGNFNPRIISYIVNPDRFIGVKPDSYWPLISNILDNPTEIWGHCWSSQIDQDCRDLVLLTFMNGGPISEVNLRASFLRLRQAGPATITGFEIAFKKSAKMCTGSLLKRTIKGNAVSYDLFNPSIGDYLLKNVLTQDASIVFVRSVGSRGSMITLETVYNSAVSFDRERLPQSIESLLANHTHCLDADCIVRSCVFLVKISTGPSAATTVGQVLNSIKLQELTENGLDDFLSACELVLAIDHGLINKMRIVEHLVSVVSSEDLSSDNFKSISEFIDAIGPDSCADLVNAYITRFQEYFSEGFKEMVIQSTVCRKYLDESDVTEVSEKIYEEAVSIIGEYGPSSWMPESVGIAIADSCPPLDVIRHNIRVSEQDEDQGSGRWSAQGGSRNGSDEAIIDLFDRHS